jgi:hypothetical protein
LPVAMRLLQEEGPSFLIIIMHFDKNCKFGRCRYCDQLRQVRLLQLKSMLSGRQEERIVILYKAIRSRRFPATSRIAFLWKKSSILSSRLQWTSHRSFLLLRRTCWFPTALFLQSLEAGDWPIAEEDPAVAFLRSSHRLRSVPPSDRPNTQRANRPFEAQSVVRRTSRCVGFLVRLLLFPSSQLERLLQ